jgi:DNA-binding GntR family transcriptional regulator
MAPIRNYMLLSECVYDEIKDMIIHDELKPHEKITEAMLSDMLHVSRTPVREALRALNSEGFITLVTNFGFMINEFTIKDAIEILQVRRALESLAARLAAERINKEGKNLLLSIKSSMEAIVELDITERNNELVRIDANLHAEIIKLAGNDRLIHLGKFLKDKIFRTRLAMSTEISQLLICSEQHKKIIDAIVAGDADEAEKMEKEHIDYIINNMIPKCG